MMQVSTSLLASTAMLTLGTLSGNCAEVGVVIGVPPPPAKIEVAPVIPVSGFVWHPGYWRWEEGRYIWIPGAFIAPPQPRAIWVPSHWTPAPGGWVWAAGYWRR